MSNKSVRQPNSLLYLHRNRLFPMVRSKSHNLLYSKVDDYTTYKPNHQPTEFEYDGETYKRYLPDKVLDFFNYEFDYLELANWQALQNLAMAYFTLIASPYEVTSGGGGGGSQSDLKWGRDPKEDEIEFARRCAQAASKRIGRHSKGGIKRK